MIARLYSIGLLLLALHAFAIAGPSNTASLADKLKGAEHVLLIRHANAPGIGDPPGFTVKDCSTQRNLDDEGRAQAVRIGRWLKTQGVDRALLFSSVWCRCQDTASGLALGPHKVEPALASFFEQPGAAAQSNQALQALIARTMKTKGGKALILVTHHVNIREYVGENIGVGDMVLARVAADGRPVGFERIVSPP